MNELLLQKDINFNAGRRVFVRVSGLTLSGAAIALLAGRDALAATAPKGTHGADVAILNAALGAEQQAIAAYQVGAESGLLQKPVLDLAVKFQSQHKAHADLLAATVKQLGGTAVAPKAKYDFPVATLKTQADVLRFAAGLEQGAVSAYLAAVPKFADRDLAKAAASILGDEAMHWAILRNALGDDPVPAAFVG
ncbi:MAG TPA: ferritin-like domain-containing protein [Casimicrobiaceae bacterium]|jgi:rubrerythrin|nr:ferritin-like domain-containing protein [Casimicrobiaceae bacterium]